MGLVVTPLGAFTAEARRHRRSVLTDTDNASVAPTLSQRPRKDGAPRVVVVPGTVKSVGHPPKNAKEWDTLAMVMPSKIKSLATRLNLQPIVLDNVTSITANNIGHG
jgi:hypothetical protein